MCANKTNEFVAIPETKVYLTLAYYLAMKLTCLSEERQHLRRERGGGTGEDGGGREGGNGRMSREGGFKMASNSLLPIFAHCTCACK